MVPVSRAVLSTSTRRVAVARLWRSWMTPEYGVPTLTVAHVLPPLSDLLKKETGRSAKDHINDFLVEKAKNLLLNTADSVSEVAFSLGFNYPHYFSRLFKSKTGLTPQKYRENN